MDLNLTGKTVLITGASGGIGAATARIMAKENAELILHYYQNEERVKLLAEELETNTLIVQADLSDEQQVKAMYQEISEKMGRIDILICNAGIWPEEYTEIKDMSFDRWKKTIAIDLHSVFFSIRSFLKQLEAFPAEHGNIVIVGSTAAVFGEAGHGDYATTKAAITYGLTKTLKNEIISVARLGRVNAVCPGWTVSPMTEKFLDDDSGIKWTLQTVPLRKLGQTEDIANIITLLASDKVSGHVSGEIITIAGGMEGRTLFDPGEIDISKAYKK